MLALAYGHSPDEAAVQARASLAEGFEALSERYVVPWRRWQAGLRTVPGRRLQHREASSGQS